MYCTLKMNFNSKTFRKTRYDIYVQYISLRKVLCAGANIVPLILHSDLVGVIFSG